MSGQIQGERRSPKRGQSVEFSDFRPYTPGDDFRRIDWNAYARLERFFLKLFVDEQDLTVHILVDTSLSMDWGHPNKLDYALHTAGALGYITLAGLDRLTVTAIGDTRSKNYPLTVDSGRIFPPHCGKNSANSLFTFLETFLPEFSAVDSSKPGAGSLESAIKSYAHNTSTPGPLVLISDLFDEESTQSQNKPPAIQEALSTLAAKGFETTVLHILAPEEVKPEFSGDLKLVDCESRNQVEVSADYDLIHRYQLTLETWKSDLNKFCRSRGINYISAETTIPLEELLFAWLRQYQVLK